MSGFYTIDGENCDLCCARCLDPITGSSIRIADENFCQACGEQELAELEREERADAAIEATYREVPDERIAAE